MRILLVEDSTDFSASIVRALSMRDHEVTLAECVDDALALIGQPPPFDVILCDYELPAYMGGLNDDKGTRVLDVFHAIPKASRPVTILWSGLDRRREVAREMKSPPDYILLKSDVRGVLDVIDGDSSGGV